MTKLAVSSILTVLLFPLQVGATTWYVGPSGNDANSCAQAQNPSTPKSTINAGLACVGLSSGAGAGDTVQVANGTYAETISSWPSGTSGNPFILKSTTQYGAVIRPGSTGSQILYIGSSYVTIDGFVTDGVNVNANNIWLASGTTSITIKNCEIKNIKIGDGTGGGSFQAIFAAPSTNQTIQNNIIHDVAVGATEHFNHALYWQASDSLIEGNTIHNVGANIIQIYGGSGSKANNVVRNNRFYDFGLNTNGDAWGLYNEGPNTQFYNNIVYQTGSTSLTGAISLRSSSTASYVYNNTIYNNGAGIELVSNNHVARNNIVFQNRANFVFYGSGYVVDHNLTSDPRFESLSSFDFRLQSTSPAIDAALTLPQVTNDVAGLLRPQGGAYDVGAYRYSNGTTLPSAPQNVRIQ